MKNNKPQKKQNKTILEQIELVLEEKIRPALKMHAGGIDLVDFDNKTGTLYVKLYGACAGCGFADETMYGFIEEELRTNIPDINNVEPVDEETDGL